MKIYVNHTDLKVLLYQTIMNTIKFWTAANK